MTKRKSKQTTQATQQPIIVRTLERALSHKRPHNTHEVSDFTSWLFVNLPAELKSFTSVDGAGNLHVDNRVKGSKTLFIAHVDTVHRDTGPNKIKKTQTHWHADGAPLGADDGAGVAMLMHLIHSGVAGYYIFSQGEECGGIGAKFIEANNKDLLKQFNRAIAFDRRGIDSVISHQGMGRCASDSFCQTLASALNEHNDNLMYSPDDTGVYTDTAEFTDIIPECTNISVGYYNEHGDRENLDIVHFAALAIAASKVDWDALPTDRDPTVDDYKTYKYDSKYDTAWWSGYGVYKDDKDGKPTDGKEALYNWPDDDEYFATEMLYDAIYDAQAGYYDDLINMIAECVYPEDPDMAVKFLNKRKLTDDLLEEAKQMARAYDASTVLCTLFDAIHCEA
jgi:hypothetical protein